MSSPVSSNDVEFQQQQVPNCCSGRPKVKVMRNYWYFKRYFQNASNLHENRAQQPTKQWLHLPKPKPTLLAAQQYIVWSNDLGNNRLGVPTPKFGAFTPKLRPEGNFKPVGKRTTVCKWTVWYIGGFLGVNWLFLRRSKACSDGYLIVAASNHVTVV